MSVDFPRAWQIARSTAVDSHDELCSYRFSGGCILCDCSVLNRHPECMDSVLQTVDGRRYYAPAPRRASRRPFRRAR